MFPPNPLPLLTFLTLINTREACLRVTEFITGIVEKRLKRDDTLVDFSDLGRGIPGAILRSGSCSGHGHPAVLSLGVSKRTERIGRRSGVRAEQHLPRNSTPIRKRLGRTSAIAGSTTTAVRRLP